MTFIIQAVLTDKPTPDERHALCRQYQKQYQATVVFGCDAGLLIYFSKQEKHELFLKDIIHAKYKAGKGLSFYSLRFTKEPVLIVPPFPFALGETVVI
jgi:hypothetical protein